MLSAAKYWLWLTNLLPPSAAWEVFCHFGTPERAYYSDPAEYDRLTSLTPAQHSLLLRRDLSAAEEIQERCDRQGIRILTFADTDYPERLRSTALPPLVLYVRGKTLRFDERAVIAMAGTRKASPYGLEIARRFGNGIVRQGGIVATGVVSGCDSAAAKSALRGGGPLVLVMPGGVDVPYYGSEDSRNLLNDAAAAGCVLSESPPGTAHDAPRFRRRNAILVGLSCGLLCVEGDRSSGAVKLAKQASEQGKDLYVVPANVDTARSSGTNDLLCAGLATPVLSPEDLLRRYDYLLPRSAPAADAPRWRVVRVEGVNGSAPSEPVSRPCEAPCAPVREEKGVDTAPNTGYIELLDSDRRWNEDERALLKALLSGPATAEALISATGLSASAAGASLVMLAVSGAVEEIPGGQYRIRPEGLS